MPSPVAHSLAGLAIARWSPKSNSSLFGWKGVLAVIIAANLADIDFLFLIASHLLFGDAVLAHREFTHSLAAVVVFGAAVYAFARLRRLESPLGWTLILSGAYLAHLIFDVFTYTTRIPGGIPLFWPLSDTLVMAPQTVFMRVRWSEPDVWVSTYHLVVILWEIAVALPFVLLAWRRSLSRESMRNILGALQTRLKRKRDVPRSAG